MSHTGECVWDDDAPGLCMGMGYVWGVGMDMVSIVYDVSTGHILDTVQARMG